MLLHYHPLVIYRFQVLKQADVVLALFLQGDHFTDEQKRNNFEYYDPITTGDSTLSGIVQSIIAAEVGYRELALRYFYNSLFVDLADLHGNTSDGVHVASTAASGTSWPTGSAGCGTTTGSLPSTLGCPSRGRPDVPDHAPRHSRKGGCHEPRDCLHSRRRRERRAGCSWRSFTVSAGMPVRVSLADQGSPIEGPFPSKTVDRRPDGTLITASVPQAVILGR